LRIGLRAASLCFLQRPGVGGIVRLKRGNLPAVGPDELKPGHPLQAAVVQTLALVDAQALKPAKPAQPKTAEPTKPAAQPKTVEPTKPVAQPKAAEPTKPAEKKNAQPKPPQPDAAQQEQDFIGEIYALLGDKK